MRREGWRPYCMKVEPVRAAYSFTARELSWAFHLALAAVSSIVEILGKLSFVLQKLLFEKLLRLQWKSTVWRLLWFWGERAKTDLGIWVTGFIGESSTGHACSSLKITAQLGRIHSLKSASIVVKHNVFVALINPETAVVSGRNDAHVCDDSGRTAWKCYSTGLQCQNGYWQQRQGSVLNVRQKWDE